MFCHFYNPVFRVNSKQSGNEQYTTKSVSYSRHWKYVIRNRVFNLFKKNKLRCVPVTGSHWRKIAGSISLFRLRNFIGQCSGSLRSKRREKKAPRRKRQFLTVFYIARISDDITNITSSQNIIFLSVRVKKLRWQRFRKAQREDIFIR